MNASATTAGACNATWIAIFRGNNLAKHRANEVINAVKKLSHMISRRPAAAPGSGSVSVYRLALPGNPHKSTRTVALNAASLSEDEFGIAVGKPRRRTCASRGTSRARSRRA